MTAVVTEGLYVMQKEISCCIQSSVSVKEMVRTVKINLAFQKLTRSMQI